MPQVWILGRHSAICTQFGICNHIAPRQAGCEVLALLNDEEFLAFMLMNGLWDACKSGVHMPVVGAAPCPWNDTMARKSGFLSLCMWETRCNGVKASSFPTEMWLRSRGALRKFLSNWKLTRCLEYWVNPASLVQIFFRIDCRHAACSWMGTKWLHSSRAKRLLCESGTTEVQKFRSSSRFPGLSLVDAIEQSIRNQERLERETKEAEEAKEAEQQQKAAERQTKAAEKQAKATQKECAEKGRSGSKKTKANLGAHLATEKDKKHKQDEVDLDFAEGGEELEYCPRPSKLHGPQE
ncbi:hypothetical protein B0H14DRAFT_2594206 [Mycena olivaceomarginata]|nr:hypothetical protein B0H14DRAFT_2594206 [Mycena olivaceomarginata]